MREGCGTIMPVASQLVGCRDADCLRAFDGATFLLCHLFAIDPPSQVNLVPCAVAINQLGSGKQSNYAFKRTAESCFHVS
jgi:hypothetical protein